MNDSEKILTNINSNIWINANAGSGKTTALIKRFIFLILSGVEFDTILAITYTKNGSKIIRQRLLMKLKELLTNKTEEEICVEYNLLNKNNAKKIIEKTLNLIQETQRDFSVFTIHAFCQKFFQNEKEEIELISEFQKRKIIDECYQSVVHFLQQFENQSKDNEEIIETFFEEMKENSLKKLIEEIFAKRIYIQKINNEKLDNLLQINPSTKIKEDEECLINEAIKLGIISNKENSFLKIKEILLTKEDTVRLNLQKKSPAFFDFAKNIFLPTVQQIERKKIYNINIFLESIIIQVLSTYQNFKNQNNLIDYDDILIRTKDFLYQSDTNIQSLFYKINHIMLDEAQDTNPISFDIIYKIFEELFMTDSKKTIFIVGDEKQSIFSFQGANIEYYKKIKEKLIFLLKQQNIALEEINLSKSYRSEKVVIDYVNKKLSELNMLNEQNLHQSVKESEIGECVVHSFKEDVKVDKNNDHSQNWIEKKDDEKTESEIDFVINLIQTIKQKISEDKITIVVRNRMSYNKFCFKLIKKLQENKIRTNGFNEINITSNIIYKDILNFFKYILFNNNETLLICTLRSFLFNISLKEIEIMKQENQFINKDIIKNYNNEVYHHLQEFLDLKEKNNLIKIVEKIEDLSCNLSNFYTKSDCSCFDYTIDYIKQKIEKMESIYSITNYLENEKEISLKQNRNGILFSTIHSSKGDEDDVVIFLNIKSSTDKEQIIQKIKNTNCFLIAKNKKTRQLLKHLILFDSTEEDRLEYVAITRAKSKLFIVNKK